jgi:bifunctional N-acetylglucosamine-1-phosphate-uridyltransferase/glucosamine-1-phosphate-acetyltransferase GlmU-like protein
VHERRQLVEAALPVVEPLDHDIGDGAVVGPFASLAPGSVIDAGARTGPFYTSNRGEDTE